MKVWMETWSRRSPSPIASRARPRRPPRPGTDLHGLGALGGGWGDDRGESDLLDRALERGSKAARSAAGTRRWFAAPCRAALDRLKELAEPGEAVETVGVAGADPVPRYRPRTTRSGRSEVTEVRSYPYAAATMTPSCHRILLFALAGSRGRRRLRRGGGADVIEGEPSSSASSPTTSRSPASSTRRTPRTRGIWSVRSGRPPERAISASPDDRKRGRVDAEIPYGFRVVDTPGKDEPIPSPAPTRSSSPARTRRSSRASSRVGLRPPVRDHPRTRRDPGARHDRRRGRHRRLDASLPARPERGREPPPRARDPGQGAKSAASKLTLSLKHETAA